MAKQILFDVEAREAVRRGVWKLSKAVVSTLGPRGRNAVLDRGWGSPTITKDGVTVAEEIQLQDPYENLGAQLVKEAASKTSEVAGDGTTTATLLADAIFGEGMKYLIAGANPASVNRGLRKGTEAVVEELKKMSRKVNAASRKEIEQVATIAGNNDPAIGKTLADAFEKVGKDGVITVEEGKSLETEVKVVEGMQFDRGYLSPHFITDANEMEVVFENCLVFIHEEKLSNVAKLLPFLERVKVANKPLLIVAEEVEGEALATLVVNKLRGILQVAAVKAPGYGDRRKAMLEDIAVLTGAKPVFQDLGVDLAKVDLSYCGKAKKVRIDADNTTIIEGAGTTSEIQARVKQIRKEIETTTSDYDREKLQERLAKLAGGIAQILIGAATETEMKERKALFEDAHHATQAALEEGILPGGGVALLRARAALEDVKIEGDERFGIDALRFALERPTRTIAENAGHDGAVVARRILQQKDTAYGFNALTGEFGNLIAQGVVDPTKVARTALQNAVSVASLLLTTDTLVVEKKEEKKAPRAGGPEDMEGMDEDF